MSTIDDIKSKLDIVDYLREQGVELKPAGSSMRARCPFHTEKTPSFMVHPAKQVFYCFGCSKGGTIFDFVMLREGLEFGEALRMLADRAGVQLEERDPRLEGKKTRGLAVLEEATKFFRRQLSVAPVAQRYVEQRRIASAMVEQFQIGYAPDAWDTLTKHLAGKGYTVQEAIEAGVAVHGKQLAIGNRQSAISAYDRFRHRLMFPIHDAMGRVVGFTGRILDGGKTVGPEPAKYVNTPETELYKKGAVLYGLAFARDAIRRTGYAVLVEGQMDVVASHGAGIAETIAVSGTALTEQQLRILKRYTTRLHVAFDADPAGQGAAERGIDAALDAGLDVRVIVTPRGADGAPIGKDADEILLRDAAAWRGAISSAVPVLDHFLARVREQFDLATPAGKRDAGRVLLAHLAHVADPIERAAWATRCAEALGVPDAALHDALRRTAQRTPSAEAGPAMKAGQERPRSASAEQPAVSASGAPSGSVTERLGNRLLALLVRHGASQETLWISFSEDNFATPSQRELYTILRSRYAGEQQGGRDGALSDHFRGYVERLELFVDQEFGDLDAGSIAQEIARCSSALRRSRITDELQRIADQLRNAERSTESTHATDGDLVSLERAFRTLTNELATLHA